MPLFRNEIETFEQNAITRLVFPRLHDPEIIPLWLGEGDLTTPDFIRDAARRAQRQARTAFARVGRGSPTSVGT